MRGTIAIILALGTVTLASAPDWHDRMSQANRYLAEGRLRDAQRLYQAAAEEAEAFPATDARRAEAFMNLGAFYFAAARFPEAEQQYRKGIAAASEANSSRDEALGLANLAAAISAQGRLPEAAIAYDRADERVAREFGDQSRQLANLLGNRAEFERKRGDLAAADRAARRAYDISRRVNADSPDLATRLHTLASIASEQHDYQRAEELSRQALDIRSRVLGANHPLSLASLANLASIEIARGQLAEAERSTKAYLAARERAEAAPDAALAAALNNLAQVYRLQHRLAEADPLYRRAIEVWEGMGGKHHPELGRILLNFGECLSDSGRDRAALKEYARALDIYRTALGDSNPRTAEAEMRMSACYRRLGWNIEAARIERSLSSRNSAMALR